MENPLSRLLYTYPELSVCSQDILQGFDLLKSVYKQKGILLVCGNGGSAADSEHIVGELMKGYLKKRPISQIFQQKLLNTYPEEGDYLASHLQGALPAISLVSQTALNTAYINDVAADMVFAQQTAGYGKAGDCLLGLSTSGRARNVINAMMVAKVLGIHTIGLTGRNGGSMLEICSVTIRVPWDETPMIQERHLPIIHTLCAMLEDEFFAV